MATDRSLEDFASGIGAGAYSPQQGSTLPVQAQAGLPFGSAPMMPPSAPPPMPSLQAAPAAMPTQRAPLISLGGQAPNVEDMIAQRLQTVSGFNQQKAKIKEQDAYAYALHELDKLQKIAGTRSQERQLQAGSRKEIQSALKEFTALTPEQQVAQRPIMQRLLTAQGQLAGMQLTPEDVQHTLKSPDIAGAYAEVLGDEYNPQERQSNMQRIGSVGHDKREGVLGAIRAEKDANSLAFVQQNLPQVVQQMGGSSAKPIDAQTFLTSPQVKEYLDKSPSVKRVLTSFLSDPKNADTLAGWGLKPGKVALEKMTKEAAGPELTGEVRNVLAGIKGPDGRPLTPATAALLPNGAEIIKAAEAKVFEQQLDISSKKGYASVLAKAAADRNVPLIQLDGFKDTHVYNKDTEMPVDRVSNTINTIEKGGGEKKFAFLNGKSNEALLAAKEAQAILSQYLDISKALTSTPGANFSQALTMWAKTNLGVDNPGVAFSALAGARLRMARAMQGSSQSLSDLDAKSVSGMLPSEFDTIPTALRRLEISAQINQNMIDVQLGKMSPDSLLDKVTAAKQEIAKMTGVDIYKNDKGQSIAVPKGQSHPGKGWSKQ